MRVYNLRFQIIANRRGGSVGHAAIAKSLEGKGTAPAGSGKDGNKEIGKNVNKKFYLLRHDAMQIENII